MTVFAKQLRTTNSLLLDWVTTLNEASCQSGQNKEGWDTARDNLQYSQLMSIVEADMAANHQIMAWWSEEEIPQGSWTTFDIGDGSLLDHFGRTVYMDWLYAAFMYIKVGSPAFRVSTNGTHKGWFGRREATGYALTEGYFTYAAYLASPVAISVGDFNQIQLQGTSAPATVVLGALGKRRIT